MITNKLLSCEEVAQILGVSKAMAYKLMRTILPTIRFGRNVRVRPDDLEKFITLNATVSFNDSAE